MDRPQRSLHVCCPSLASFTRNDLVDMKAFENRLLPLVDQRRREADETPFALVPDALHGAARMDGVSDRHRLQETAALLDEDEPVESRARVRCPQRGERSKQQSV